MSGPRVLDRLPDSCPPPCQRGQLIYARPVIFLPLVHPQDKNEKKKNTHKKLKAQERNTAQQGNERSYAITLPQ
jgi:hypothetical protein